MKCFQAVESVFLVVIGKQNDQYSPSTDGPTDGVHLNSDPEAWTVMSIAPSVPARTQSANFTPFSEWKFEAE